MKKKKCCRSRTDGTVQTCYVTITSLPGCNCSLCLSQCRLECTWM